MRVNFHTSSNVVVSTLAMIACTGALALLPQRTFVASTGDDVNAGVSCRLTAPCRSFSVAIGQTRPGGEVLVLDSAGYGPVTITQAVSIIAPAGVYAGVSVFSGDGVTVNAGTSDTVVLRGLTITGVGGANGVVVNTAGSVDVGRVEISGFSGDGIKFNDGNTLILRDSISRQNGHNGFTFSPAAGGTLIVERSSFDGNSNNGGTVIGTSSIYTPTLASIVGSSATGNLASGFVVNAAGKLSIQDCRVAILSGHGYYGISADGAGTSLQAARCEVSGYPSGFVTANGATAQVTDSSALGPGTFGSGFTAYSGGGDFTVDHSIAAGYAIGFYVTSGAAMRVSNSTSTLSFKDFHNDGTFLSRQNNTGNGITFGTITPLSAM